MDKKKIRISITDFTDMGQGVGRITDECGDVPAGLTVFVQGAYPGDEVLAEITKVKKNYANADAVEILAASSDRIESDCPYCHVCGGCTYREYAYDAELCIKEKQVRDKLTRIAGIDGPKINPIVTAEPKHYRNKCEFAIGPKGEVGFYSPKSHRIFDCENCNIQMDTAMAAAEALRTYISEVHPSIYNRNTGEGLLRGMVVKTAKGTGEVMVIIIATENNIPKPERLAELLDDAIYNVNYSLESIIININKKNGETLGDKCITLAGKPTITEQAGELSFEISPLAFYQVNPDQMLKLYGRALEYANIDKDDSIFDLYCGVGTIGLFAAKRTEGMIYGIESVKGAVLDANRNAVINSIVNARYLCGLAEDEIVKLTEGYTDRFGEEIPPVKPDVVILDPPRAGCEQQLLEAVMKAAPERIVYVSCDPGTLARDIKILGDNYSFVEATPVDMFPRTGHVETVVLMTRTK